MQKFTSLQNSLNYRMRRNNSIDITRDFRHQTQQDALKSISKEINKIAQTETNLQEREKFMVEMRSFMDLFEKYLDDNDQEIEWSMINKLKSEDVLDYSELKEDETNITQYLNQLAVLKLNGGLGTSMGCTGPKSLISVRSELTFLDLTMRQIEYLNKRHNVQVPLVLMNSFNTDADTKKVLPKYSAMNIKTHTFIQSMYPRINRESLLPICTRVLNKNSFLDGGSNNDLSQLEEHAWYPPGHGDVYRSLYNSGVMDELLDNGIRWLFVSNIDNLGACVDNKILSYLMTADPDKCPEFLMEVTKKERADVKGGTLIRYEDELRLLEIAQVPKKHRDEFTSIKKFDIFNTNNLWINLPALKTKIMEQTLNMEVIVNPKTLENGINVIQLEEASGAAIKSFRNPIGLKVPRSRFLPVKTTSDLLLVMSNYYSMKQDKLRKSESRSFDNVPVVKLGSHFKKVKDFLQRFNSIPDLLECDHLTVSGDVTFGQNVVLRGTVIIIATHGETINIPSGAILENKIVTGNLRILDH